MFEIAQMLDPYGIMSDVLMIVNDTDEDIAYSFGDILKIDDDYTFSCWMCSDNASSTSISISQKEKRFNLVTDWQRVVYTNKSELDVSKEVYFIIPAGVTLYAFEGQLETGTVATDWRPAPEDIQQDINDAVEDSKTTITEEYTSSILESARELKLAVENVTTKINENTEMIVSISNQLEITSELAQFVKRTTETIEDALTGKVSKVEIEEWARFNGAELSLGASNSVYKAIMTNEKLSFYVGSYPAVEISSNYMKAVRATFKDYICIDELKIEHIKGVGYVFGRGLFS